MASNYSSTELFGTGSLLKENFTAGTEYTIALLPVEVSASTPSNTYLGMETLTFVTPALPLYFSGSIYSGSNVYGSQTDNYTQGIYIPSTNTGTNIGPLAIDTIIPPSSTVNSITGAGIGATFIFDVVGDLQGSGAEIALTATLVGAAVTATITQAKVVKGGENYISGDGITITQNDIQAAGFTNADASLQLDIFPNYLNKSNQSEIKWTPLIDVTGANVYFKATGLISASITA